MLVIEGGALLRELGDPIVWNNWFLKELSFSAKEEFVYLENLYKRYIKFEDITKTKEVLKMKSNTSTFAKILYDEFLICLDDAISFLETWNKYLSIHLSLSDMIYCVVKKNIPLEDYDNLEGDPLWMRPEYMLEKYGGK
jgi:hypothetical protein